MHRLGGAHRNRAGGGSERSMDRCCLCRVVSAGGRAVRVDIADIGRAQHRTLERHGHRSRSAVGGWIGDVSRVAGDSESADLAEDPGTSAGGMLEGLQHQNRSALGQHQAFPIGAEWPACRLRVLVVDGQHPHRLPGANNPVGQRCVGAARENDVGSAGADGLPGLADRVRARGASRHRRVGRTLCTESRRHRAGCRVVHRPADHRRRKA